MKSQFLVIVNLVVDVVDVILNNSYQKSKMSDIEGKRFVFKGTLLSSRDDAAAAVNAAGGLVQKNISKATDVVVASTDVDTSNYTTTVWTPEKFAEVLGVSPASANSTPGKKNKKMSEDDLLLERLKQVTASNSGLKKSDKKDSKKDRQDKKKALIQQKQDMREMQAEEARKRTAPYEQLLELLRSRQMTSDYLETPKTDKEVEEVEDDRFMGSSVAMQAWRISMEDAHIMKLQKSDDDIAIFSVFDGHSGTDVAIYAAENLEEILKKQPEFDAKDYPAALTKTFIQLDDQMRAESKTAGSTATVCIVTKDTIYCANSGDSRAVLCEDGKTVECSEDHKPDLPGETARIEAAGGTVVDAGGIPRVNGSLAVSRGLGDFSFKAGQDLPPQNQQVTCVPDIRSFPITDKTDFLVVACDGIWDCLSSEECVERVKPAVAEATTSSALTAATSNVMDSILVCCFII